MAHRHRFDQVAGSCGRTVRCGCGKTKTIQSWTAFDSGTRSKSSRGRKAAKEVTR